MELSALARAMAAGHLGLAALLLCWAPSLAWAAASSKTPGLEHDVVFTEYSPLAHNAALAQRLLTPLTSARLMYKAALSGAKVRDYPLDLEREKYVLFVPSQQPVRGYGAFSIRRAVGIRRRAACLDSRAATPWCHFRDRGALGQRRERV